jgi:hypothetical protein
MIYFPGTINIVSTRLYCHIIYINNGFTFHFPAVHVNLLCACWHSEAVKGSSSLFSRRLLISLCITSFLFLCPEPTDAPCPYYGDPAPPFPRWRPHPQGPHTLPHQGPRHLELAEISKLQLSDGLLQCSCSLIFKHLTLIWMDKRSALQCRWESFMIPRRPIGSREDSL